MTVGRVGIIVGVVEIVGVGDNVGDGEGEGDRSREQTPITLPIMMMATIATTNIFVIPELEQIKPIFSLNPT